MYNPSNSYLLAMSLAIFAKLVWHLFQNIQGQYLVTVLLQLSNNLSTADAVNIKRCQKLTLVSYNVLNQLKIFAPTKHSLLQSR
jgi:hypothetical protein